MAVPSTTSMTTTAAIVAFNTRGAGGGGGGGDGAVGIGDRGDESADAGGAEVETPVSAGRPPRARMAASPVAMSATFPPDSAGSAAANPMTASEEGFAFVDNARCGG